MKSDMALKLWVYAYFISKFMDFLTKLYKWFMLANNTVGSEQHNL